MEVTGNVIVIEPMQEVSASFKKRVIVVKTEEQYPQEIAIEFTQDKTSILDNYAVGQNVKISINLRGRSWLDPKTNATKYFNTIQGWRIEKAEAQTPQSAVDQHQANQAPAPSPATAPQTPQAPAGEPEPDLPF